MSFPEPYVRTIEAVKAAGFILSYFSDLGINVEKDLEGIEVGYGGFSSQTLSSLVLYTMDINDYNTFGDIDLRLGDATTADLSGLDFLISLGLPKLNMKVAEKVLENAAKHRVQYAILSPRVNNPGGYELNVIKRINEEKELCFYILDARDRI